MKNSMLLFSNLYNMYNLYIMKVVLITGALGGIGLALCKQFKNQNWIVVGTSRTENYDSIFIDYYISKDLSNENAPKEIMEIINDKYGRLDCLVNNAACQICKPIWEMESSEWDFVLETQF